MALGIMGGAGGAISEEEKKRREQLAANAPRLGLTPSPLVDTPKIGNVDAPKLGLTPNQQEKPQAVAPQLGLPRNVSDKTIADEYKPQLGLGAGKVQWGNPDNKRFGLSVDNNAPVAPALNSAPAIPATTVRGFGMPNAPRLSWSERNDRDNLLAKIGEPLKGAQNGQLTASQRQLMADIEGRDQKYANDQYNTQMNAASQVAQAQLAQDGANARTVLEEAGNDKRFNTQFGFDVKKAQAENEIAQQKFGFDAQRAQATLDINRYNADTSRMRAETAQEALDKKGVLTEKERNDRIGEYKLKANSLNSAIELVDGMIGNTKGLAGNVGWFDTIMPNFREHSLKFNSDREALLSQAFLTNSDLLKGVLTDMDAKELKNAFGNLQDTKISEADYAKNLGKARDIMEKIRGVADERYKDVIPYMDKPVEAAPTRPAASTDEEEVDPEYVKRNNKQGDIEFDR